jgi:hypothetical protein
LAMAWPRLVRSGSSSSTSDTADQRQPTMFDTTPSGAPSPRCGLLQIRMPHEQLLRRYWTCALDPLITGAVITSGAAASNGEGRCEASHAQRLRLTPTPRPRSAAVAGRAARMQQAQKQLTRARAQVSTLLRLCRAMIDERARLRGWPQRDSAERPGARSIRPVDRSCARAEGKAAPGSCAWAPRSAGAARAQACALGQLPDPGVVAWPHPAAGVRALPARVHAYRGAASRQRGAPARARAPGADPRRHAHPSMPAWPARSAAGARRTHHDAGGHPPPVVLATFRAPRDVASVDHLASSRPGAKSRRRTLATCAAAIGGGSSRPRGDDQ